VFWHEPNRGGPAGLPGGLGSMSAAPVVVEILAYEKSPD
jgi:hypothetical protein